jgi:hypothetical protein
MKRYAVLVATAALVFAGCSSAIDRSDVLAEAADASTTTTAAPLSDEEGEVVDDLVTAMRADAYAGFSKPGVTCIATGFVQQFGLDIAKELAEDFRNGEVALAMDDAREAAAIVLGCVDYRAGSHAGFVESGLSTTSADCFFGGLTDAEIELGAVMDFVDDVDYDAPLVDLADKAARLMTACVSEDEMADLFTHALLEESDLGSQLSLDEAGCLSRALLRDVGIEAMGEFGDGGVGLRTAEALADALMSCVDFRALLASSIGQDGDVSPSVASCLVERVPDAVLREVLVRAFMQVDPVDLDESLSAKLAECGADPGGT